MAVSYITLYGNISNLHSHGLSCKIHASSCSSCWFLCYNSGVSGVLGLISEPVVLQTWTLCSSADIDSVEAHERVHLYGQAQS